MVHSEDKAAAQNEALADTRVDSFLVREGEPSARTCIARALARATQRLTTPRSTASGSPA